MTDDIETIRISFVLRLIDETVDTYVKSQLEDFLIDSNRCPECGTALVEDDFSGEYEPRGEFWGAPCSEYITTGFVCHECGHEEEF